MAALYIHIPFCKQRCRYCAFYSTTLHTLQEAYVAALCKELAMRTEYADKKISTIYLGGGTPSLLTDAQLHTITNTIKKEYHIAPDAEVTIECNPDDLTPERLALLHSLGFNRISMGVQSFDDKLLKMLGRRHTAQSARNAVEAARAAGFSNISIDLMFALPGSTAESWASDLRSAIELYPNHISAYNLTYEEDTPLQRDLQRGIITELSEEENLAQFNTLVEELGKAGYRHYEISNFALPGCESRHNSSYWNDTPYTGCGAAAHSYDGSAREWNIADIKEYIKGIESGKRNFEVEHLSLAERYNDAVLTRLRTAAGINPTMVKEKFGDTLYNYMIKGVRKEVAAGNLQKFPDGCYALTRKGIFVSDAVIRELIYVE